MSSLSVGRLNPTSQMERKIFDNSDSPNKSKAWFPRWNFKLDTRPALANPLAWATVLDENLERKRGCTQNVFLDFRKHFPNFLPFHAISDRKSRKFWSNGKRPRALKSHALSVRLAQTNSILRSRSEMNYTFVVFLNIRIPDS